MDGTLEDQQQQQQQHQLRSSSPAAQIPDQAQGTPSAAALGAGNGGNGKAFQRAYKACDQCRQRKVRCDLGSLEQPLEPPCRRCRRELRQCTWLVGSRGKARLSVSGGGGGGGAHVPPAGFDHAAFAAAAAEDESGQMGFANGDGHGNAIDKRLGDAGFTNSSTPKAWSQLKHPAPANNGSMQPPSLPTGNPKRPTASASATGSSASTSPTRSASMPQIVFSSHHPASRAAGGSAAAGRTPEQYPSHLGIGGVGDYFAAAAGVGVGVGAGVSGLAPHTRLVRSSSSSSLYSGTHPGIGGGVGGGAGGQAAGGADQASDASSPTSRASLALIKLSNSSEAVKALSYVGNTGVDDADDDGEGEEVADRGGAEQQGVDGAGVADGYERRIGAEQGDGRKRKASAGQRGATHNGTAGGSGEFDSRPAKSRRAPAHNHSQQQGQGHLQGNPLAPGFGLAPALLSKKAKKLRDWRDFEPVRQKIVKASEAKYLFKYFFQHVHGFSPLCSERYMRNTKEMRSELISREPLLLGAILSIASRFCIGADQDAAANMGAEPGTGGATTGSGVGHAEVGAAAKGAGGQVPGEGASFGLALHQRISAWTHRLAGRVLVDCSLHSIGSVEGLLLLSEWSTWGIHSHTSDYLVSDDETSDAEDAEGEGEGEQGTAAHSVAMRHDAAGKGGSRRSKEQRAREAAARRHAEEVATTSQRFDSMSWMFVGMAIRLAEELQLQKPEYCVGIYSDSPEDVESAERRLRVWLDCVRADTQISIRLGRRFTCAGLSPEWMEAMRARTYRLPDTLADPIVPTNGSVSASSHAHTHASADPTNSNFTQTDDLVGAARHDPFVDEARKWVAWRGHAELVNKLRNAHDMLNESEARTQSMMENDRFESILRPFRNDLDSWVRWLEPKIGYPGGGMRTFGIRIDYHFTRLTVFRLALDALVLRARKIGRPDGLAALGEGLSDSPTFPFAKEAVDAARSLAVIISVDLQSLRCAPPKYFLYLVLAVMVCMQACELSESLMLPMQCASILREAINALNAVTLDERHLAHRYALMLRNAGKRLLLAEETDANQQDEAQRQRLVSDLKLINSDQHARSVPTITVVPRVQAAAPPPPPQGPSFASDIVPNTQGTDLADLWSWLGNIDQAVPSASHDEVIDPHTDSILNFDLLSDGNAAPFFFPNTALNN